MHIHCRRQVILRNIIESQSNTLSKLNHWINEEIPRSWYCNVRSLFNGWIFMHWTRILQGSTVNKESICWFNNFYWECIKWKKLGYDCVLKWKKERKKGVQLQNFPFQKDVGQWWISYQLERWGTFLLQKSGTFTCPLNACCPGKSTCTLHSIPTESTLS